MKRTLTTALTLAAAGALFLHTPRVHAQDDAPPPPPPPAAEGAAPAPGGGPGGDRADRMKEFRERMKERVKTQLKATDEEWAVIEPLLTKVEEKQREAMMARFAGPGGAFGGGGPGGQRGRRNGGDNTKAADGAQPQPQAERPNRPARAGSAEAQALSETLQADSNVGEIKAKLAALRDQRKKSEAELTQSREDLKKVLNLRQEATLVLMGILD